MKRFGVGTKSFLKSFTLHNGTHAIWPTLHSKREGERENSIVVNCNLEISNVKKQYLAVFYFPKQSSGFLFKLLDNIVEKETPRCKVQLPRGGGDGERQTDRQIDREISC